MLRLMVRGLLEFIWPPRADCVLCQADLGEESDSPVCPVCWDGMTFAPGLRRCSECARPMAGAGSICSGCVAGAAFGKVWALGPHIGPLREAIHHLKFGGREDLALMLGERLGAEIKAPYDFLVPVPLHRSRLRERGYNQAELVALGMRKIQNIPVSARTLVRLRDTGHQAKLDRASRHRNLDGAFGMRGPIPWRGKSILLVDDVLTTGATASAVAQLLRASGAAAVNLAVLAVSTKPVDASDRERG